MPSASKRKPSDCWLHFTKKPRGGRCNYCQAFVSSVGSTGNFVRHLRVKHPDKLYYKKEMKNEQSSYEVLNPGIIEHDSVHETEENVAVSGMENYRSIT